MKTSRNKHINSNSHLRRNIVLGFFAFFFTLLILEISLRIGGFILFSLQEYRNSQAIKQNSNFRIICLGESTTQNQYPRYLMEILNKNGHNAKFNVFDKGQAAVSTTTLLLHLEDNLDKYKPDMVVAMMGCNDYQTLYYLDIPGSNTEIFKNCRLYRFARIIYTHILQKIKKRDIYRPAVNKNLNLKRTPVIGNKTDLGRVEKENEIIEGSSGLNSYINRGYGIKYTDYKKTAKAKQAWKKIISLNPKDDRAYAQLGMLYCEEGKFTEAEKVLNEALAINPSNYAMHVQLGRIYRDHGEFTKSERLYKKAAEISPENYEAYAGLERLYRNQGRFEERNQIFKKIMALTPKTNVDYLTAASLFSFMGEFTKSRDLYMKAIELDPQNDIAYAGLGNIHEKTRKFSESEEAYKKAIELAPDNDPAYMDLYWVYREQGKSAEAEEILKKAIVFNPHNDLAIGGLAVKYLEAGETGLAQKYFEQVNTLRRVFYNSVTADNYNKLKQILDKRKIKLVCVQYPMRSIAVLKKMLTDEPQNNIIFVDNERIFKEAVSKDGYNAYFTDMFGGDFGHCTEKGNRLLAGNIAAAILKGVFDK
jgi:tetratricopeptide (TPR) repeat protein